MINRFPIIKSSNPYLIIFWNLLPNNQKQIIQVKKQSTYALTMNYFYMFHPNIGINYLLFIIRYSTGKTIPRKNCLLLPKHWEKSYKNLTDYSQNYSVDKSDNSPSVLGSPMPITHNASQQNKHCNWYCVKPTIMKHFQYFHLLFC